jgi:coproporphyrinogen III oxidase
MQVVVQEFLTLLQQDLLTGLGRFDAGWQTQHNQTERGHSISHVLQDGAVLEKAALHFSTLSGKKLPPSAVERRPHLAGQGFWVSGVSLIVHPRHPFAPTVHLNYRFFLLEDGTFWFGGGADLTPHYPFAEDAVHFHCQHKWVLDRFDQSLYPGWKIACDQYFYNHHRREARGIGGVFFDDFVWRDFDSSLRLVQSVSGAFLPAYLPILERRQAMPYTPAQRDWQLYRRGRYVEFNLLHDRGTLFGLQNGGRVENILSSLPPMVRFVYDVQPDADSPEAALSAFLEPKDWANLEPQGHANLESQGHANLEPQGHANLELITLMSVPTKQM